MAISPRAKRIREAVDQSGLTKAELSRRVGVSWTTINNWCTGRTEPSAAPLLKFAAATGRDAQWILHGKRKRSTSSDADSRVEYDHEERHDPDYIDPVIEAFLERHGHKVVSAVAEQFRGLKAYGRHGLLPSDDDLLNLLLSMQRTWEGAAKREEE